MNLEQQVSKTVGKLATRERLYINFVRYVDGDWGVCWYPEWLGATHRREAVRLRREFFKYLREQGGVIWKPKMLKTVRVL